MKVKICGITNLADALVSEKYGADAIGFIFYKKSKRFIDPVDAKEIILQLSPFTMKIGVFVNEEADLVNQAAEEIKLNAVQLHGEESPEYIKNIRFPVIKSFRVSNGFDYSVIDKYGNASILLDTYSAAEYGGTGTKFNWNSIPVKLRNRIVLAGGVSVKNIGEIMTEIKPAAIDVSSSLEDEQDKLEPGIVRKNETKIKQLFQIINTYRS